MATQPIPPAIAVGAYEAEQLAQTEYAAPPASSSMAA